MVARAGQAFWFRLLAVVVFVTVTAGVRAPNARAACVVEERPTLGLSLTLDDDPIGLNHLFGREERPPAVVPVPCPGETPSGLAQMTVFEPVQVRESALIVPDTAAAPHEIESVLVSPRIIQARLDRPPRPAGIA